MEATKTTFNAPEIKLHFLDYWRIIRIRKTVIIAVFLLVAITATLVTYVLPESFLSTVRIRVDKDASDVNTWAERPATMQMFDPYWMQTEFETLKSKKILYQVISNQNLNIEWAAKFKERELRTDITYGMLRRQVDVGNPRNTSLIEIRVYSQDKKEAAEIANEIAKVYRDTRLSYRKETTQRGIDTLEKQWDEQDKKVQDKQKEVDKLKVDLNIPDAEASGYMAPSTLSTEHENLAHYQRLRVEAQADYHQFNTTFTSLTNLSRKDMRRAILTASPDLTLGGYLEQLANQQQKLADLQGTYSDEHPDVLKILSVIKTIDAQIDDRVEGIIKGLKTKVDAQKAKLDGLIAEVEMAKTNDVRTAIERRQYFLEKRDLDYLQQVREKLAVRILQEKVDLAVQRLGIVEILDQAEPSYKAVRPNKPFNIALGIIAGLAIGVGLAFFIEYLDTSVKTIDDVERALQAPVLGVIPQNVGSLLEEGPDSPHAEAYRVLRTNILFSQKDAKLNTITIVSGGAGEGKSTTTFNLAAVFAQNGQRVLIVDSDLRRPSLHKMLRVSNSIGLTNYLLKQNTLEEVIQTTPLPTLDFLPSGKLPSSSMGVLSSQQMKDLIRDLKRRYDFIFFDSPPIMGVSDASILASEVDMVMQVIQYRRYPQPMTIRAKQMIEKVGGNLVGIVLNNINMASDENYYYYSGYYYDYYAKNEESTPDKVATPADRKPLAEKDKVEIKSKY